jgi:exodeoxyribonuclease VII small subunit
MAKDKKQGQYGEVGARLQQLVEELEGGELPLEDSLEKFEAGIGLVKQAETILGDAEKRIEQLLSEDGKTTPLKAVPVEAAPAAKPVAAPRKAVPTPDLEDDVPF